MAGVRRVQRQLYRGGTTVVRGAETVSATVQRGAVILELGDSSRGFCSPRHGRQDAWGRARRLGGATLRPQRGKDSRQGAVILRDRDRLGDSGITNWRSPANAGS